MNNLRFSNEFVRHKVLDFDWRYCAARIPVHRATLWLNGQAMPCTRNPLSKSSFNVTNGH